MASSDDFTALLTDADGKPFPGLLQYIFPELDYAKLLKELKDIPAKDVDRRMNYLAEIAPGLVLIADCLASRNELELKQLFNSELLHRLRPDQPGTEAGIAWQSSCAYKDVFDNFLAKSPVLTKEDIDEARNIPLPSGGTVYLFELLKTRQDDALVTEWHWLAVLVTNEGTKHFLEGVFNLFDIPTANKTMLERYYGDATKKYQRMPAPDTPFTRFHGTKIGPEDMTLGGIYQHELIYGVCSAELFGWDEEERGRPFWAVRHVLQFNSRPPEVLRDFIAMGNICKKSNEKGAPLSADTHYILNSCLGLLADALYSDIPELRNRPLHELMISLAGRADAIHLSHSRQASVDEFLSKYLPGQDSAFVRSNVEAFDSEMRRTMGMRTLRESHDGQPPSLSMYFANHQIPSDPALRELLEICEEISLVALCQMVTAGR